MKIAFAVIVKGDEELDQLKTLMDSTEGVFDGVFITTNGKEFTKTKKYCEKQGYKHSHLHWNDNFAEQRNFNFAQVPETYDYICWADSDDVIVNPKILKKVARIAKHKGFDAVMFDYWYGNKFKGKPSLETFQEVEVTQQRERLLKPGSIVWKKRLHESPVPTDGQRFKHSNVPYSKEYPIAWMHLGADRDLPQELMDKRMARNRKLLELDLRDEREDGSVDPRTILYLMKIYAEDKDPNLLNECIKLGEEYMTKSGWDYERAVCCRLMGICYGKLGQHNEARKLLHQAISEYPFDPLLYLHLSRVYFNLKNYSAMKHWLEVGLTLKDERKQPMENLLELKILSYQLALQYYFYGDKKNTKKAWQAAKMLAKIEPIRENVENEARLFDLKELDAASGAAHQLMLYLKDIGKGRKIPDLVQALPYEMKSLPFAQHFYTKYKEPKVWKDNEICYFANFGQEHFEKWSPMSLKTGLGGSETAVVKLSEELTKLGWKVTVYGDPGQFEGNHNGVLYLPWFKFNQRDKFNIFIQWRHNSLAGRISAKKFMVDLHDIFVEGSYKDKPIDHVMVKSEFHRNMAAHVRNVEVISNGIN